jgi:hypothetical protein
LLVAHRHHAKARACEHAATAAGSEPWSQASSPLDLCESMVSFSRSAEVRNGSSRPGIIAIFCMELRWIRAGCFTSGAASQGAHTGAVGCVSHPGRGGAGLRNR